MVRREGRGKSLRAGLGVVLAAALLVFVCPSPGWSATFTATAAIGSAVTMDDPTGSVTFTITNTTVGPARQIDRVRFYFTRTQYFIARGTAAPTNWTVRPARRLFMRWPDYRASCGPFSGF